METCNPRTIPFQRRYAIPSISIYNNDVGGIKAFQKLYNTLSSEISTQRKCHTLGNFCHRKMISNKDCSIPSVCVPTYMHTTFIMHTDQTYHSFSFRIFHNRNIIMLSQNENFCFLFESLMTWIWILPSGKKR